MRKLLILSVLTALAGSATGCTSMGCGESWRPGYYLFGWGRHPQQPAYQCCDPCGGGAMMSAPAVMAAPVATAPCCQ